jgi:methylated-DNA-protein-cysteine methyltransferase-like protein
MNSSSAGKIPQKIRRKQTTGFAEAVLQIVKKIPKGKVLTYGQVATIAGVPRAARMVGGVLHHQGAWSRLPWQRVINAKGGISTYRVGFGEKQKVLLEREGLQFNREGHLDFKKYQWWPSDKLLKQFELDSDLAQSISRRIGFR